ncbi:hypothetical protein GCM10010401_12440 [Rarobacter faecitabidus]|uniref:Uncharacterized protein n=1 Tax=Rarobacter faecitabidus TaxID=13243 RepID=A0A542ZP50_RARFA|nr:hypothetical protein [Rarobacter faecitabidus]TQL62019.1 hypothetical protein FB461_1651 [Rarobacter faecitabidus]
MSISWDTMPRVPAATLASVLETVTILPLNVLRPLDADLVPQIMEFLEEHRILAFVRSGNGFGMPTADLIDLPVDTAAGRCINADAFGWTRPAMRPSELAQGLADRLGRLVVTDELFASMPGGTTVDLAARPEHWYQVWLGRRPTELTRLARKAAEPALGTGVMDSSRWGWRREIGNEGLPALLARVSGADLVEMQVRDLTLLATASRPLALATGVSVPPERRPVYELHRTAASALLLRSDPEPGRDVLVRLSAHPGHHISVPPESLASRILFALLLFNDVPFARTGGELEVRVADEILRVQHGLPLAGLPARLAAICRVIDDFPHEMLAEPPRNEGSAVTHLAPRDEQTGSPVADPRAQCAPRPYRFRYEAPSGLNRLVRQATITAAFLIGTTLLLVWFLWANLESPGCYAGYTCDQSQLALWTMRLLVAFAAYRATVTVGKAWRLWQIWGRSGRSPYPFEF